MIAPTIAVATTHAVATAIWSERTRSSQRKPARRMQNSAPSKYGESGPCSMIGTA